MKKYYIAYGSNLDIGQMKWRCPGAKVAGVATLKDWKLMFRGSKTGSYLTIEHCPGAEVPVGVWEITAENERALDRYEGFPAFYFKHLLPITVTRPTGRSFEAVGTVYIMHSSNPLGLPSTDYMTVCKHGYQYFGFDAQVLEDALATTKKEMESA